MEHEVLQPILMDRMWRASYVPTSDASELSER
jgi:hypothetical protein